MTYHAYPFHRKCRQPRCIASTEFIVTSSLARRASGYSSCRKCRQPHQSPPDCSTYHFHRNHRHTVIRRQFNSLGSLLARPKMPSAALHRFHRIHRHIVIPRRLSVRRPVIPLNRKCRQPVPVAAR
jgi:hypothetical protein